MTRQTSTFCDCFIQNRSAANWPGHPIHRKGLGNFICRLSIFFVICWALMADIGVAAELTSNNRSLPTPPVRVMSFNIRFGTADDGENHWVKRKDFLAETIAEFDPDLLGTQETLASQRDFLKNKLADFDVLAAGRDDGKEAGEMAALYYRSKRFEKVAGGHFWLSQTPDQPGSKGWDAALPRIATWVKLRDRRTPSLQPILFVNTHLDHRGATARRESAQLLRSKMSELGPDCRWIVTGDFNAGEGSEPHQALFGDIGGLESPLVDTYRIAHADRKKDEGTFSGFKAAQVSGARIDWIACSRDWQVRMAGIDRTARADRTPSDHFPVTAVLRPGNPDRPRTLRVLSYNIHHGEGTDGKIDLPRLARVIRAADPDLTALQEVDNKTKRTGHVDQTAELARLTGLHGKFGKAIDYDGGEYGQALLSRFPFGPTAVQTLPGEPDREQRMAFVGRLMVDQQPLSFATTHLHHANEPIRLRQATTLNEVFASMDHPMILAGDLNAIPESPPMKLLKQHWAIAAGKEQLLTFPAGKPNRQIDYVLWKPTTRFRLIDTVVMDEPIASDHRPVLAEIELLEK